MLVLGDFNLDTSNAALSTFIENNGLYSMIKTATCFKSATGRCIDLILTNRKHSFKETQTFETGFSDFHHMIFTILKLRYHKLPPKKIKYRDYRKFSEEHFLSEFSANLAKNSPDNIEAFICLFDQTLDKFAFHKTVTVRGNNKPHMSKALRKAMMQRTRLKNKANKSHDERDLQRYRQQRNLIVKMNRRAKKEYFKSLDLKDLTKNKRFWKSLQPMFSDSSVVSEKFVLIENDKAIRDDQAISEHFNHYFANITDTLKIAKVAKESVQTPGDPVQNCIQAYSNHPCILRIKGMVNAQEKFVFSQVDPSAVFSEIQNINATKKTSGAIPTDKLELASNICYKEIAYHINNAIVTNTFPDILKLADVSPIFKNGESTTDVNYRPISVLSSLSKIYERLLSK